MARDWQAVVDGMAPVQKLAHLAMRKDSFEVERVRMDLLKVRRRAYEDELTMQAARVGCPGRRGRLTSGPSLNTLNDQAQRDATSIVNTYNYDLALAVGHVRSETPTANRHVYAKRLTGWSDKRDKWKNPQIRQFTVGDARSLAQADFQRFNNQMGTATLKPTSAVCPVCAGWVARGEVPLHEALNNPPPYHVNCPHNWDTKPERVARAECPNLWMGE